MASGGLPVRGGLAGRLAMADLQRVSDLLAATGARHLIILGDLLHARSARDSEVLDAVTAWRDGPACAGVPVTLVRGNHDRHAGDPPAQWRMSCVDGPWPAGAGGGPLALVHEPLVLPGRYCVGGHVHPVVTLGAGGRAGGGERLRSPCFVVGPERLILPAFGRFTGGAAWGASALPGDTVALAGERAVFGVPGPAPAAEVVVRPENRAAVGGSTGRAGAGPHAPG
jgi:metallophosphoesterase superfamily enzyme